MLKVHIILEDIHSEYHYDYGQYWSDPLKIYDKLITYINDEKVEIEILESEKTIIQPNKSLQLSVTNRLRNGMNIVYKYRILKVF